MLGAAHPPKEPKKKAARKVKSSSTSTSTSSRTSGSRPRKTTTSTPTPATSSSVPPSKAKAVTPSAKAKRAGTSPKKKRETRSSTPVSTPERHEPTIPLDHMLRNNGLNPIALPKGFKGRKVVYVGHKVPTTDKILYKGETFVIQSAVWFKDYKNESLVRFQIFHTKMKFGLSILPEDLRIGKKNLGSLAKAMLKHAGR